MAHHSREYALKLKAIEQRAKKHPEIFRAYEEYLEELRASALAGVSRTYRRSRMPHPSICEGWDSTAAGRVAIIFSLGAGPPSTPAPVAAFTLRAFRRVSITDDGIRGLGANDWAVAPVFITNAL
jgi:hypothetical protein